MLQVSESWNTSHNRCDSLIPVFNSEIFKKNHLISFYIGCNIVLSLFDHYSYLCKICKMEFSNRSSVANHIVSRHEIHDSTTIRQSIQQVAISQVSSTQAPSNNINTQSNQPSKCCCPVIRFLFPIFTTHNSDKAVFCQKGTFCWQSQNCTATSSSVPFFS